MTRLVTYSGGVDLPVAPLYPVSLDVAGRAILLVGGGEVAARKAAALVECGARLTVVAPGTVPAIDALEAGGTLVVERRTYRPGEASGYRLVVTATGRPDVDAMVATDADGAGVWVNAADDVRHCSFQLPAVHRDGQVTIAVSTGGASPALATWLRSRLADAAGDHLGDLAAVLGASRTRLHAAGRRVDASAWRALLDGPLPAWVAAGDIEAARQLVDAALGLSDEPRGHAGTCRSSRPEEHQERDEQQEEQRRSK